MVTSVALGHLSIALLVVPPLTLVVLRELLVRQRPRAWVVGLLLAALVCARCVISVEVLALMGIAVAVGVVAAAVLSWPRARAALPYAAQALAVAAAVAAVALAWPSWYLLAGPRHVSGVPFQGVQGVADGRLFHLWTRGRVPWRCRYREPPPAWWSGRRATSSASASSSWPWSP